MELFNSIIGFEWDEGNIGKNWIKHKVSNKECEEVFFNEPIIILNDEKHSNEERRYLCFGKTEANRKLTIIFTLRNNLVRIISAREQNRKEKRFYNEEDKKNS
jgi:hypothetical protein